MYKWITAIWKDPVWSKVIAAIIVSVFTSVCVVVWGWIKQELLLLIILLSVVNLLLLALILWLIWKNINEYSSEIHAKIITHTAKERDDIFDALLCQAEDNDEIWILGTGVTSFLNRDTRIEEYLKKGIDIKILLINNELLKEDDLLYCYKEVIPKIESAIKNGEEYKPLKSDLYCDIRRCNFLVRRKHLNKYYKRNEYDERVRNSYKKINDYKLSKTQNNWNGTIEAKHFCSFVPMSITVLKTKLKTKTINKNMIIEYILPFTEKRILFESSPDKNNELFKEFSDYLDNAWESSESI